MIGIYFSGTGNTKHCVEKLVKLLDASAQSFSLEHTQMIQILEEHDIIVLGYPTQFSNAPIIVRDFIKNHSSLSADIDRVVVFDTQVDFEYKNGTVKTWQRK